MADGQNLWTHGKEAWCNLQGRYTTIVADYATQSSLSTIEPSICDLGVFGTLYVRDQSILDTFTVTKGTISSFVVAHIYSELEIANELDIAMR